MSTQDGVARYTCTRVQMIGALGEHPLGEFLTLEARAKFADRLLEHLPEATELVTEDQAREIMQATVAEGVRPVIDAELAKSEAVIRADERERCAVAILAHVADCDHPRLTVEAKTHLDGLRVAAAFLRDGLEGVRDWEPQP